MPSRTPAPSRGSRRRSGRSSVPIARSAAGGRSMVRAPGRTGSAAGGSGRPRARSVSARQSPGKPLRKTRRCGVESSSSWRSSEVLAGGAGGEVGSSQASHNKTARRAPTARLIVAQGQEPSDSGAKPPWGLSNATMRALKGRTRAGDEPFAVPIRLDRPFRAPPDFASDNPGRRSALPWATIVCPCRGAKQPKKPGHTYPPLHRIVQSLVVI